MPTHDRISEGSISDYERVGGAPAIRAVVDRFYELVLQDERLVSFFTRHTCRS